MNQRDKPGTYFPVPKSVFLVDLPPGTIAVYVYLMSRENRQTYDCIVGHDEIARAIGMSIKTVPKHIHTLIMRGLIETERTKIYTKNGEVRLGKLKYTIKPIEPIAAIYEERRFRQMIASMQAERALEAFDAKKRKDKHDKNKKEKELPQ